MEQKKKVETLNKKSLAALLAEHPQEILDVYPYTTQSGKAAHCFTIGDIKGHVAENLSKCIDTAAIEDIVFAEVKTEKGTWMPCLFLANRAKSVRSFSL